MREFRKKIYRELKCEHFCVTLFQKKKTKNKKVQHCGWDLFQNNNNNNNNNNNKTKKSLNSRFIKKKKLLKTEL